MYFKGDKSQAIAKFKDDVVLLHPSLMQLTGICIGSHCVLNNCCVRVVWPSTSLPLTGIGLQDELLEQLNCVKGQLISVASLVKVSTASLVELTCSDARYESSLFIVIKVFWKRIQSINYMFHKKRKQL